MEPGSVGSGHITVVLTLVDTEVIVTGPRTPDAPHIDVRTDTHRFVTTTSHPCLRDDGQYVGLKDPV